MSFSHRFSTNMLYLSNLGAHKKFLNDSLNLEATQREKLKKILSYLQPTKSFKNKDTKNLKYEDFTKYFPITSYQDFDKSIQDQMNGKGNLIVPSCDRFQPTSGSTSSQKWIPYTKEFLKEFDQASAVWINDLLNRFPSLSEGSQYWSLSWLPNNQRKYSQVDDSKLFNFFKQYFLNSLFTVPSRVSLAQTSEAALFASATFLCADSNLSLISVWSPTFLISLLDVIKENHIQISKTLFTGEWQKFEEELQNIKAPLSPIRSKLITDFANNITELYHSFWPNLSLISCWDTSLATFGANKIKKMFPQTPIQGKGLWATEAVVTIPFKDKYPLAYRSHFYEFYCSETDKVIPSWKLEKGMRVIPIITASNGLVRYKMEDLLVVNDFYNQVPCFEFLGRQKHVDLVGEKLSYDIALEAIKSLKAKFTIISPVTLLAIQSEKPYYALLLQGEISEEEANKIENNLEFILLQNFHYRVAREVNQLDKVKILASLKADNFYLETKQQRGVIKGNIKPEPITIVQDSELKYLYE